MPTHTLAVCAGDGPCVCQTFWPTLRTMYNPSLTAPALARSNRNSFQLSLAHCRSTTPAILPKKCNDSNGDDDRESGRESETDRLLDLVTRSLCWRSIASWGGCVGRVPVARCDGPTASRIRASVRSLEPSVGNPRTRERCAFRAANHHLVAMKLLRAPFPTVL